jgi:hypothetical protein
VQKFNKGRKVEGHWIIGMIDVETKDLRIFVCHNNKRDANTLLPAIEACVEKGSIVRTDCWSAYGKDCWSAYGKLSQMGYVHQTVNHSETLVSPEGVDTNLIESSWRFVKDHFRLIKVRGL